MAPLFPTQFQMDDGRAVTVRPRNTFIVDSDNPVTESKCNVGIISLDGTSHRGTLSIEDVGPVDRIPPGQEKRGYYIFESVSLDAFPATLRAAMVQKAKALGIVDLNYDAVVSAIAKYVALCAETTAEQVYAAAIQHDQTPQPNAIYDRYNECAPDYGSKTFSAAPKAVLVYLHLLSIKNRLPYRVTIQFNRKPIVDHNDLALTQTEQATRLELYDRYGIGNYFISKN